MLDWTENMSEKSDENVQIDGSQLVLSGYRTTERT